MTITSLVVTLQVCNISIDPADPHYGMEDLSINDIESCVELVLEIVMGHQDAVQETDEHDDSSFKPAASVMLFSVSGSFLLIKNEFELASPAPAASQQWHFDSLSRSILSPPPKKA